MKKLLVLFLIFVAVSAESCIQCNSNINLQCATKPQNFMAKTCQFQNSTCFTEVVSGLTIRGCSSELNSTTMASCLLNQTCQNCNQTTCNNKIFPTNRPTCYQCDSRTESNCSQSSVSLPLPCPIFKEGDQCYIYKSPNSFKRGCLSSSGNNCRNISQCLVCSGHGCNDFPGNNTLIPNANDATWQAISSFLLLSVLGITLLTQN